MASAQIKLFFTGAVRSLSLIDLLVIFSFGLLVGALVDHVPLSGVYASPWGAIAITSKPTVPICLLCVSLLARIAIRNEGGKITRLVSHPTAPRFFLIALLVYTANGSHSASVDSSSTRVLPYSLIKEGNLDLDEFRFLYARQIPPFLVRTERHMVSAYPAGAAILAVPFYLLPAWAGVSAESKLLIQIEKFAASVFVALSVVLLYGAIKQFDGPNGAASLAWVYAFGTSSLSISSQGLWQHGPSQLLIAASLYLLVLGVRQERWVAVSGLTLGAAVLCRPTDFVIAFPLAAYVLHVHRNHFARFAVWALPTVLFMGFYNWGYFGSPLRIGYDQGFFAGNGFATPFLEGLAGILWSPSRGLFVYSPVLLFSVLGGLLAWRRDGSLLLRYLSVSVLLVVLLYSHWKIWWGGWAFGPRLLADLAPVLIFLIIPTFRLIEQRVMLKRVFYLLAGISIVIHALGAYAPVNWNPDLGGNEQRLWSWRDGELATTVCRLVSKLTDYCIIR